MTFAAGMGPSGGVPYDVHLAAIAAEREKALREAASIANGIAEAHRKEHTTPDELGFDWLYHDRHVQAETVARSVAQNILALIEKDKRNG